ncbi:MAG: SusC/RagA family TonB-linked outer membrane protein [Salibacteraceae bacterium]
MRKIYLLLSACCLFTLQALSQQFSVSGLITDETNQPLPGVNVFEKGTQTGTSSDAEGRYQLQVSGPQATLVFRFLGFETLELPVNGQAELNAQLQPSAEKLKEVVVTALNLKRESTTLGYSIQKLESKEISEVKSPYFVDQLAGQVAGVTVSQGATGVGSTSRITIRGEASFSNNNPLFVVDGTPINNNTTFNFSNEAAAGFQEVDFGNGAMEVNPDDIASVSVLKGPAAAALYGTRAANGVILITTKSGKNSKGLGISINSSTFIDRPFQLPEFQNQFGQGNSGQFEFVDGLGGGTNDNITYSWGPALDQGILIPQFDSPVTLPNGTVVRGGDLALHGGAPITPTAFESHPNNLRDFYETGITAINNVSIANGNEQGSYRLSFTDLRSDSYIPGVNLNRKTTALRLNYNPMPKLSVNASINYVNSQSDNRPSNGYGSENVNYSLVAWGPRSLNIANLEDYWQPGLEEQQQYSFNYTFFDNPYFILLENRNSFNRDRVFGNLGASYQLTEDLTLQFSSGMDYTSENRQFRRHFSTNRFRTGAYAEQDVFFREVNTNVLLTYKKVINDFQVEVSAGGNRMDQTALQRQTEALSLAQPGIFNFSNASSPLNVFQFENERRINSVYAFAKLGYRSFLFLDISGRNDWSSTLATPSSTDNTSFFYPSVALSYIASNTFELPEWVSLVKLRANWAQVGNDTDPYQTTGAFVAGTPFNSQPTFTAQNTIANANLVPEQTTAWEVGADVRFIDDRVRVDFTYYDALTENQILSLPVAISSGYDQQVVNGGAVRNRGVEILLGLTPIKKEKFTWNSLLNFSRNVATVEDLPEQAGRITLAYSRVYDNVNQTVWFQVEEGGRIGDFYGTGYLRNENGDFVIGNDGRYIVDNTLKKLGNYNPDFILGISNAFSYGKWDMSFLIDWRQGGELVSRTLSLAAVGGQLSETENRPDEGIVAEGVVNVGTEENPIWQANTTAVNVETYYRQFYDRNHEENNVYSATYVKLRQVSIGYTFRTERTSGWLKKGRALRLALVGRNLYAWSEIPHFDPEQLAVQGNQLISGVEDMSYPTARSYGFKVSYNF